MTNISLTTNGITFTFAEGEVESISSITTAGAENEPIAVSGPMHGYNYSFEGATKTITVSGMLFDTTTRIAGYTITTALFQKRWLESLANGMQSTIYFTSNYEDYSVSSKTGATLPFQAALVLTEVMISSAKFVENIGDVTKISFELTFIVGNA